MLMANPELPEMVVVCTDGVAGYPTESPTGLPEIVAPLMSVEPPESMIPAVTQFWTVTFCNAGEELTT
jgi:hypothetical protein